VSRRHALFRVSADSVDVEDLGSRNGVLVNRQRVVGRTKVLPGDSVLIGGQEMTLIESVGVVLEHPTNAQGLRATLVRPMDLPEEASVTKVSFVPGEGDEDSSMVRRLGGFRVLASVADKALALGRGGEAERVLAAPLLEVLEASRRGDSLAPELAEGATRLAAKLATATGKGLWVDYVIEIYAALARPVPAVVIDELYTALRKATALDVARLKAYVEALRRRLPSLGPADRFLVQRIEGLERLALLRS
jgi:FHA domain